MNNNIEKLLSMLSMELIRVREDGNLATMHAVKLEIDRIMKTDYTKLEDTIQQAYIEALDGKDEAEINNWLVTYKSIDRFALDSKKLQEYFESQGQSEEEMKNLLYSHSQTKPTLKFKTIK
jgi:hypothetical protein